MEAGEILFQNNPVSSICSVVCIHEQQCAGHCIRGKKDSPIHFFSIEHYLSDMYLDRMEITKPEPKDKKVAVIGAGPAGMTVAILSRFLSGRIKSGASCNMASRNSDCQSLCWNGSRNGWRKWEIQGCCYQLHPVAGRSFL